MHFADSTALNRKSGAAERRDPLFYRDFPGPLSTHFFRIVHVLLGHQEAQRLLFKQALVRATVTPHQLIVRTFFHDAPLVEDQDAVEHPHRR